MFHGFLLARVLVPRECSGDVRTSFAFSALGGWEQPILLAALKMLLNVTLPNSTRTSLCVQVYLRMRTDITLTAV